MQEKLHTIPVNEAFEAGDECPFCYLERETEERAINYTIGPGASYMEPEIRAITDEEGFCTGHMKKLFDYGNALGCSLILQTYFIGILQELEQQLQDYELPPKRSIFRKKKVEEPENVLDAWLKKKEESCFICKQIESNKQRYYETFFALLKEEQFRSKVEGCKGFCLHHFRELLESAKMNLPNAQREWFYKTVFTLTEENLIRVKEDLDWFVAKNDYRNAGADWKNSRDALARTIQKLRGIYPADPPYRSADFGIRRK